MSVATLGGFPPDAGGFSTGVQGRSSLGQQKPLFNQARAGTSSTGRSVLPARVQPQALLASIAEVDSRVQGPNARSHSRTLRTNIVPVPAYHYSAAGPLPEALYRLLDPTANVDLPPAHKISQRSLDNRELDKLVAALGRSKATWRRAILLHEWLQDIGHRPDDRLCTTLIRLCSAHGAAAQALGLYDWMRSPANAGGAGLRPTVFTYTAAMRAALNGNLPERAMQVWQDAKLARCNADCRMSTVYIEVCTRAGNATAALNMYKEMAAAPPGSKLAPSVHTYTAAMRAAAAEGGTWHEALTIWDDMLAAGCTPTGHAYAAAISACATGGEWRRAVALFDSMLGSSIQPDVVSCTALISALAADGQWQHAQRALDWMLQAGVKPNVRTYTALITAMANAHQWERALTTLKRMKDDHTWRRVEPNAYTYSALLKLLGEHGQWQLAEKLFAELEVEALRDLGPSGQAPSSAASQASLDALPLQLVFSAGGAPLPPAPGGIWGAEQPPRWDDASPPSAEGLPIRGMKLGSSVGSDAGSDILSSGSFGEMPKALAEQVLDEELLDAQAPELHCPQDPLGLPDCIPGQSNLGSPHSHSSVASSRQGLRLGRDASQASSDAASTSGSGSSTDGSHDRAARPWLPAPGLVPMRTAHDQDAWMGPDSGQNDDASSADSKPQAVLNVVVCGALMSAYENASQWTQAVNVLSRARRLGIKPNTVMYNVALSALGKSGDWQAAEALFEQIGEPDSISYETMIAAMGISGQAGRAEFWYDALLSTGHHPRDYAFTAMVAAHSLAGDWRSALRVRQRMRRCIPPVAPTVYVYNALIAACDREGMWDHALELHNTMRREGVQPNQATMSLMAGVGKGGCSAVDRQQRIAAALSAAVAAAGGLIMRTGVF